MRHGCVEFWNQMGCGRYRTEEPNKAKQGRSGGHGRPRERTSPDCLGSSLPFLPPSPRSLHRLSSPSSISEVRSRRSISVLERTSPSLLSPSLALRIHFRLRDNSSSPSSQLIPRIQPAHNRLAHRDQKILHHLALPLRRPRMGRIPMPTMPRPPRAQPGAQKTH